MKAQRKTIRRPFGILLAAVLAVGSLAWAADLAAAGLKENLNSCRAAVRAAEVRYDLPTDLLLAIGIAESGLNPYAINLAGTAHLPDNVAAAELILVDENGDFPRNVAVGCMQLYVRYHLAHFANRPERMFDAASNVDYAARMLSDLYATEGSWTVAVGRYNAGSAGGAGYHHYICLIDGKLRELGSDTRLDCNRA